MSSIASITAEVYIIFGACEVGEFDLLLRFKNILPHICDCESFSVISEIKTAVGIYFKMVPLEYEVELQIAMVSCLYSHTSSVA
jgi:hypothetical protein